MAATSPANGGPKLSFASVGPSKAVQQRSSTDFVQVAAMAPPMRSPRGTLPSQDRIALEKSPEHSSPALRNKPYIDSPSAQLHREMSSSMARMALGERTGLQAGSDTDAVPRSGLRFDDELTHISYSSTKQASSDSRSVTSGATFGLDEKESLRPDDSASTKAAEDEDSHSGVASGAPSSRVGSEAGGRAFRDQFNEISERIGPGLHRLQSMNRRGIPGIIEEGPQPTLATCPPSVPAPSNGKDALATNGSTFVIEYKGPDEKLFEALDSPKDRLFVIKLEQDVISFINNSNEPILDLPPCNSFCRLLAHKLADYYALTHYVDNAVSSVRLYRTPYCRTPTPLSLLAKQMTSKDSTPVSQTGMKIMRREGLGKDGANTGSGANTNASSMAPSKANSEMGDDGQRGTGFASPTESANANERANLTREEREAKYKETRERIFKGFEDTDSADPAHPGDSNGMSRTSSGTGKKRSKKPRNHDDGFEARSQFNAYYPAMQYPTTTYEQTANTLAYYSPYPPQQPSMMNHTGMMGSGMLQNSYSQGYQPMPDSSAYPMGMQGGMMSGAERTVSDPTGLQSYPGYGPQYPPQYCQPMMMQQPMMGQQSPVIPSPNLNSHPQLARPSSQMSDQNWAQHSYPYGYQQSPQTPQSYSPQMHHRTPVSSVPSMPYQFGQLPYQPHSPQGKPPHPLPGSYNRQAFNPQTRAFVPSTSFNSQPPQFGGISNEAALRSPLRFPSGSSTSSYTKSANMQQQNSSHPKPSNNKENLKPASQHSSPQPSSLAKWGTPANLPPKPPPPEVPIMAAMPESLPTNPANAYGPASVQPMIYGQPMPTYQNGVYGMPGGGQ